MKEKQQESTDSFGCFLSLLKSSFCVDYILKRQRHQKESGCFWEVQSPNNSFFLPFSIFSSVTKHSPRETDREKRHNVCRSHKDNLCFPLRISETSNKFLHEHLLLLMRQLPHCISPLTQSLFPSCPLRSASEKTIVPRSEPITQSIGNTTDTIHNLIKSQVQSSSDMHTTCKQRANHVRLFSVRHLWSLILQQGWIFIQSKW